MSNEIKARITADNTDFKKKTKETTKEGRSMADRFKMIGGVIAGAFIFRAAFNSIKNLIGGMMQMADRFRDLADITGMSTDAIQEYQYVAKIAGVNVEAVSAATEGLTQRLARGLTEMSPLNVALKHLGLSAHEASGELRSGADIMEDVITQLADMEDVTQRNVLGAQIFAGAWKDMAPILGMGAEGIEKLKQEARDMGIVMDKETLEKIDQLRRSKVRLQESSAALGRELGMVLVPILTKLSDGMLTLIQSTRSARRTFDELAEVGGWSGWDKIKNVFFMLAGDNKALAKSIGEVVKENEEQLKLIEETVKAEQAATAATVAHAKTIANYKDELADLKKELDNLSPSQLDQIENINKQIDALEKLIIRTENYRGMVEDPIHEMLTVDFEQAEEAFLNLDQSLQNLEDTGIKTAERLVYEFSRLEEAALSWGEAVMWAGVQGEGSMKDYARTVIGITKKTIAAYLAEAVAASVAKALASVPFPFNLAAGAAAGGMAAALFNAAIPAFAAGGAVSGPTLALVGEGPGVNRANPEFIGTAKQLGMGAGVLTARVSRGDLLFILNEGETANRRNY